MDALVELSPPPEGGSDDESPTARRAPTDAQFRALFEPRGVLVTGASSHPGKFGFVSLHNLLASGYAGGVYGTNLKGEEVLGIRTVADIDDLPDGEIDLVFVCTPAAANPGSARACARKGIGAAFLTSAGYGEAGDAGRRWPSRNSSHSPTNSASCSPAPTARASSAHRSRSARQIVAPYPPAGSIGVASQSGNFVSTFLNLARMTGVGISRAVSAGNAAGDGTPTTSAGTPRMRRPPSASPTSKGSPTGAV